MMLEGFKSIFGFIWVSLKEEEKLLLVEKVSIVVNLMFCHVFMELMNLFSFIFVMLDLSEVEESAAFFAFFGFFLFL